jgi:hypothetical protein
MTFLIIHAMILGACWPWAMSMARPRVGDIEWAGWDALETKHMEPSDVNYKVTVGHLLNDVFNGLD